MQASPIEPAHAYVTASRVAGRYLLGEALGTGGMGAVHRAVDSATGRVVAFKQLHASLLESARHKYEALFEREYHTLVRLKHPRIIEVYEYGVTEAGPYYTMELLGGQDLQQLAPLPYREVCRHLRDVASSLALIHAHRLVHRDLSPRNVRLTQDGRAKLIDFGALGTFGPASDVIGTAMCTAPEAVRRMPLDQRTDLYALGAVGYWALTGRHAYPARRIAELTSVWQRPPRAPSELVAGIPRELDALILSLLQLDPQARPPSAAAVIDPLTAIGELEPEEHEQAAESYLLSGRLVGRDDELAWARTRIARALEGRGAEIVIDGGRGVGKTRLLHELSLEAQLRGMVALKADAQASRGAFGAAIALADQLASALPEQAARAAGAHAPLLAQLSPELKQQLGVAEAVAPAADPNERRLQLQTALHEWFAAIAAEQPVLIAVDNLQAADDSSAAFLAALGQRSRHGRLIVLATQRTGDELQAPAPVRSLRRRSAHLRLGGLNAAACEELVTSLFGDVANKGRVAKLLHERSAGNPQQCMELAQGLVRRKIAKYAGGTWVLPFEVAEGELPSRIEELLSERLCALGPGARALAEALSVHGKPVPIERCLSLAEGVSERDKYAALDELVAEQFLLLGDGCYRFEQDALRQAVLAQIDDVRRKALHLRAGEALLAGAHGEHVGARVEAAWHLLHAGEESRGADLLASAGREFLRDHGANESVEQVVAALSTALEVYERQGRSEYEIARVMFALLPLAFYIDRRVALRHGTRAIEIGMRITGLGLARRLRPLLGVKLALRCSLLVASVRFAVQKRRGLRYELPQAIGDFCSLIPSTVGTFNICYDLATVEWLARQIAPLRFFGAGHIASFMCDYAELQLLMGTGRELEARTLAERMLEQFQTPAMKQVLGDARWKAMHGGMKFCLGILYNYEMGSRALETARDMQEVGVRVWAMAADQIRLLHHALRGESERAEHHGERVELFAVQGSTTWQAEIFWPVLLLDGAVLTGDTIAARRIWEQLARHGREAPSLALHAELARAAYLALRGDLAASIAVYDQVIPRLTVRGRVGWSSARAWYAEALNLAGRHAQARQIVQQALSHASEPEHAVVGRFLELQRQLALADAGLGDTAAAIARLDALITRHGGDDQPLLVGLLHKARAEVALGSADAAGVETHLSAMERCFRATRNPALLAQWERLCARAIAHGLRAQAAASLRPSAGASMTMVTAAQRALTELAAASDPRDYAVRLCIQQARAQAGYLYLRERQAMRLAAATSQHEPPHALEQQLLQRVQRAELELHDDLEATAVIDVAPVELGAAARIDIAPPRSAGAMPPQAAPGQPLEARDQAGDTIYVDSEPPPTADSAYQVLLLRAVQSGRAVLVGGLILEVDPRRALPLDDDFLDAVASSLHARHATTMA